MKNKKMYEVEKEIKFKASHKLYSGGRVNEELHFHDWRVILTVRSDYLNGFGYVLDYDLMEEMLNNITKEFKDKSFNDILDFKLINPTAENIACYIAFKLKLLYSKNIRTSNIFANLFSVKVFKDFDSATYYFENFKLNWNNFKSE